MDDASWSKLFSAGTATTYKKEEVVSSLPSMRGCACAAAPHPSIGFIPCLDACSS